jgi:pSer/pThr/pTyr-binding forkhead associated (FHA) protein
MWILRSLDPEDLDLTFRLLSGEVKTLGRAAGAQIVVDAPLVSRVHCRFTVESTGQLVLEDLDSTNGTFVNGQKVSRTTLGTGDSLKVGRVRFAVSRES